MNKNQYSRIFLDSGAFSLAHAKDKKTFFTIYDYIDFIKENKKRFSVYANLDVIGDAEATWKNQEIMEKAGLSPLPVFHMEDPMPYLNRCLEYKYFALGGMAGASAKERDNFFNRCWDIICDKDGFPKTKVHGFGLASPEFVYKYPWFSIDTSSWVSYGRFGIIIIPKIKNDRYDFSVPPIKLFVTKESPKRSMDGMHYQNLTETEKEWVHAYLEYCDCPFGGDHNKGVSNDNFWRDLCNFLFFSSMCKFTKKYPWAWKRPECNQTLFME